jgi:hypothetical protein
MGGSVRASVRPGEGEAWLGCEAGDGVNPGAGPDLPNR